MAHPGEPQFRLAGPADAEAIANLHADSWRRHYHNRRRIGSRLLALTAQAVTERPERTGLYLWVLEQNVDAQAFYRARGGRCLGKRRVSPPGGIAGRLAGSPMALRYAWPELNVLRVELLDHLVHP